MTPEQVALLTAIVNIIDRLGTWPIALIIFFMGVGPWVLALILAQAQKQRMESVIRMYENNVELVKSYDKISQALMDIVSMNIAKWTEATEKIDANQYCPPLRVQKKRMEDVA